MKNKLLPLLFFCIFVFIIMPHIRQTDAQEGARTQPLSYAARDVFPSVIWISEQTGTVANTELEQIYEKYNDLNCWEVYTVPVTRYTSNVACLRIFINE